VSESLDRLKRAEEVFRGVLANVSPEQMELPTPNEEWDVKTVISHMILGCDWATVHLRGGQGSWPPGADAIGDRDPHGVYADAADRMLAAFSEPGAVERTVNLGGGEMPASTLATIMVGQFLDHAWDLARASGQDTDRAPDLYEAQIEHFRGAFAQSGRGDFHKEAQPVADSASAADRLAAFLGKTV
jgi:uncharacterized protein (TIGR03086 family)